VAEQVRERLFDAAFLTNILAIAAPLPVFLAAIALTIRSRRTP
jgi:hypothetical protein